MKNIFWKLAITHCVFMMTAASSLVSAQTIPAPVPDDSNPGFLSHVAGGREFGEGGPALTAFIADLAWGLDVDSQDRPYVGANSYIRREEKDGTITTVALVLPGFADFDILNDSVYTYGFPADAFEGRAIHRVDVNTLEEEIFPELDTSVIKDCCDFYFQIAVDSHENIYLAHRNRIYRIDAGTGDTTHIAGTGNTVFTGDDVPALEASFTVQDMVIDRSNDTIVISDSANRRISRIDPATGGIESSSLLDVLPEVESDFAIRGLDIHPSGDVYFASTNNFRLYRLSAQLDHLAVVAGSGEPDLTGDGGVSAEAGMMPSLLAVDSAGDIYFSSGNYDNNLRVRRIDVKRDIVSTVIGQPGFLGCASPLDSRLVFSSGIATDSRDIIYTQTFNAILAIDRDQGVTYTVAGNYGNRGESPDGVQAFGNPLHTERTAHSGFAVSPQGDIFLVEPGRLRKVDDETGLLETLAQGDFRMPFYHPSGRLYVLKDYGEWVDFVEVDPETGVMTTLIQGGADEPRPGETAEGRRFKIVIQEAGVGGERSVNDVAYDKDGNIYLSINDQLAPELPSGIYKIDPQTRMLSAVIQEAPDSTRAYLGQLALDEDRAILYTTWLAEGFLGEGEYIPVAKLDLETGEQTRFAGLNTIGSEYCPQCGGIPALDVLMMPIDLTVAGNGDLYVLQNEDYVQRISAESPSATTLIPDDIGDGSNIGNTVARRGDWMAVGVPNSLGGAGEVLVYQDIDCRPILRDRLQMPVGYTGSQFGNAVVFAGSSLVIGASGLAPPAIEGRIVGARAEQDNSVETDPPLQIGIFGLKNGRSWSFDKSLANALPPSGGTIELVADDKTFAVGIPDANQGEGEVVVFSSPDLDTGISVKPPGDNTSNFGKSIALDDNQLAVGSDSKGSGGKVDLWRAESGQYVSVAVLESPSENPGYASALALNADSLYVGSPDVDGGKVYDYTIDDQGADLSGTLIDPESPDNFSFGSALALENGILVVGAPQVPGGAAATVEASTGARSKIDSGTAGSGAIVAFGVKNGSGRKQSGAFLFSKLLQGAEAYGHSVDVENGRIVVGAPETNNGKGTFEAVSTIADPAGLSGLWYDPSLDGEGFNMLVTEAGLVVFFYGYDTHGDRLWLISDVVVGDLQFGSTIDVSMYKATQGTFSAPVQSAQALVRWGILSMTYGSLGSATMILTGFDGSKISRAIFLADVTANAARYSGLWFEPALDGEGFNVISAQAGNVIYYYGSSVDGERLWLISDVLPREIEDGTPIRGRMYEAMGGDFYHPEPSSSSLRDWGSIEARFDDCVSGQFILTGQDGEKTSNVVKLAGVDGADCD